MSDAVEHLTTFLSSGLGQPPSDEHSTSAIAARHALYQDMVEMHTAFRMRVSDRHQCASASWNGDTPRTNCG